MQGKKISDPEAWKTLKKQEPSHQGQEKAEGTGDRKKPLLLKIFVQKPSAQDRRLTMSAKRSAELKRI